MTLEETAEIIDFITEVAYPGFYKFKSDTDIKKLTELWAVCMADIESKDSAMEALTDYIKTDKNGYPPIPGQIRGIIEDNIQRLKVEKMYRTALLRTQKIWELSENNKVVGLIEEEKKHEL